MRSSNPVKSIKKLSGALVGIPPRHINFSFPENMPKYFYAGNATATTFFAMLSGFFPPGERYFMESVRHFRNEVKDETLRAEISGFMGQEAIHGREHDRLNNILSEYGFDMQAPDRFVKIGLAILEKLPPSTRLAATTFMEHFTALLAEQLLNDEQFVQQADPEMIKIWQWHALEELEHKSVAYDVYELIGNSRIERAAAALASVVVLLPMLGVTWSWMLAKDGQLGNLKDNIKGLNVLLGRNGFVSRILSRLPEFVEPNFHPNQHNTKQLESNWRDKLFAVGGALHDQYSNSAA
ncbi:MAG: metal hydrolase [Alcanivorax borkumensis]|jgi:predicted metal-dependent hydrolase|uniref:Predicted metal hydrolase, putative n=1 Tax=Alcanivorax borkumensis (strain ATCC 700651 / DSM 11573 / NCIMB 13689 / SK2) TaxID=393595 RepID=Q0VT84_ALCBS|nr:MULTISPECIES: metal-dependent hydrolase [Alcanivorax]OJH08774.1 MAG: metal hydrolase [Alcanivorax borkumensis]BAP13045.1 metal hydrolase [Alcanivorax sp. NBRC 101098]CAL15636.1 predicted metal hydrolase, putative [Alcanivorax borkumensis SK2]